jgi:hypothetical protein
MKCACDAHAIQKRMLSPLGAIFSLVRRRPLKIIRALLEVATIAVVVSGFYSGSPGVRESEAACTTRSEAAA